MDNLYHKLCASIGFLVLSSAALAASESEQPLTTVTEIFIYAFVVSVIVVAVLVYFTKLKDKRNTPVDTLLAARRTIHSVGPDTLVTECVRTMSVNKIGALIVMDGEKLVGIFTERDALNKVLVAGLEPSKTKVCDVMTRNPYTIAPTTTVGEAMELVTKRRFRHLPIVKDDAVLAVISSGDLTHWLVKDEIGEVQELVDLAAKT